jgi:hypothetical protein
MATAAACLGGLGQRAEELVEVSFVFGGHLGLVELDALQLDLLLDVEHRRLLGLRLGFRLGLLRRRLGFLRGGWLGFRSRLFHQIRIAFSDGQGRGPLAGTHANAGAQGFDHAASGIR